MQVPLRVAVVQAGVGEKVIATKAYQTTVTMGEDTSVPFSMVADELVYPAPSGAVADSYVFYIGFDPQALKPEPEAKTEEEAAVVDTENAHKKAGAIISRRLVV